MIIISFFPSHLWPFDLSDKGFQGPCICIGPHCSSLKWRESNTWRAVVFEAASKPTPGNELLISRFTHLIFSLPPPPYFSHFPKSSSQILNSPNPSSRRWRCSRFSFHPSKRDNLSLRGCGHRRNNISRSDYGERVTAPSFGSRIYGVVCFLIWNKGTILA